MIRTPDLLAHRPFDFTTGLGEPSEGGKTRQALVSEATAFSAASESRVVRLLGPVAFGY